MVGVYFGVLEGDGNNGGVVGFVGGEFDIISVLL